MERNTRQRTAIRLAIEEAGRPLLPSEVLQAAQQAVPSLSLATVYRCLKSMSEQGEISPVSLPSEITRYELAGHRHHHHFQCRQCGRVFDVHDCPGNLGHLAPAGFEVESHDLTLYGRCGDCLEQAARVARAQDRGPARRRLRPTGS